MKSLNLYEQKFKKYGVDPKSLLWKNRGAAHQRFRQFWSEIDFNNKSVLDIGCGFGEFGKFLLKRYEGVDYTGIDNVSEFIEIAKKDVPSAKFDTVDFNKLDDKYDVVIASGVLNSNVRYSAGDASQGDPKPGLPFVGGFGAGEWQDPKDIGLANELNFEYRKKAIKKMFSLTTHVLAFNMLGGHPVPENDPTSNIYYSDSLEILEYCLTLTRRVILRHHYNPKDFTIFLYKVKEVEVKV